MGVGRGGGGVMVVIKTMRMEREGGYLWCVCTHACVCVLEYVHDGILGY